MFIRTAIAAEGYRGSHEAGIKEVLGSNAPRFYEILDQIIKSIYDLMRPKSNSLRRYNAVSNTKVLNLKTK
jgi:hypothetical protein